MEKMTKLRPCPFCGGGGALDSWGMSPWERTHIESLTGKWYSVFCTLCGAAGPDCLTDGDAEDAWNKRV